MGNLSLYARSVVSSYRVNEVIQEAVQGSDVASLVNGEAPYSNLFSGVPASGGILLGTTGASRGSALADNDALHSNLLSGVRGNDRALLGAAGGSRASTLSIDDAPHSNLLSAVRGNDRALLGAAGGSRASTLDVDDAPYQNFLRDAPPGARPPFDQRGISLQQGVASDHGLQAYADRQTVASIIEPDLAKYIIDRARLEPEAHASTVWARAWATRVTIGSTVDTAVPPPAGFFEDLIDTARARPTASLGSVVVEASNLYHGLNWFDIRPGPSPTTPDYTIHAQLLKRLVAAARANPYDAVKDVWGEASSALSSRALVPARELVGFIVLASRAYATATPEGVMNLARAQLLYRGLGGDEPDLRAVGGLVESFILETIVRIARANPLIATHYDAVAVIRDELWPLVLAERGARWELPWPPVPRPDLALLSMLVQLAIMDPNGDLTAEQLLAFATVPLRRTGPHHLAVIRQAQTQPPADKPGGGGGEGAVALGVVGGYAVGVFVCGFLQNQEARSDVGRWCREDSGYAPTNRWLSKNVVYPIIDWLFISDPVAPEPKDPPEPGEPMPAPDPDDMPNPVVQPPTANPVETVPPRDDRPFEPPSWWNPSPITPLPFPPKTALSPDQLSTDRSRPDYAPGPECGACEWEIGARFVDLKDVSPMLVNTFRHAYINLARPHCGKESAKFWLFEAGPSKDRKKTEAYVKDYHEWAGIQIGAGLWPRPCEDLAKCLTDATLKYHSLGLPYDPVKGPNSNSFAEQIADKCGLFAVWHVANLPQWDYWRKHGRPF